MSLSVKNRFIVLDHLSLIEVQGEDHIEFLQGQLTQDVKLLTQNQAKFAGFCNPKGRLLAFMLAYGYDNATHIQIDKSIEESILKRLKMFVLRSKVSIQSLSDQFTQIGFIGSEALTKLNIDTPQNFLEITTSHDVIIMRVSKDTERYQLIGKNLAIDAFVKLALSEYTSMSIDDWNNESILDGIPEIFPSTQESFIPQSLNMDLVDGINFKKGCYTGQEIVARTHYLGKVKRRMYRVSFESEDNLIPGNLILNEKKEEIGQLIRSASEGSKKINALIELRVDEAHESLYIKQHLIHIYPEDQTRFD
jgi:folate-binding protein YgfZ